MDMHGVTSRLHFKTWCLHCTKQWLKSSLFFYIISWGQRVVSGHSDWRVQLLQYMRVFGWKFICNFKWRRRRIAWKGHVNKYCGGVSRFWTTKIGEPMECKWPLRLADALVLIIIGIDQCHKYSCERFGIIDDPRIIFGFCDKLV